MALVTQSIKNLKGGVSQQPDILRYPEQAERQINAWSSETEGLQKRPPTLFRKVIGNAGALGAAPLVHLINRDEFEQYLAVFTGSDVRVFDLQGNEKVVRGDRSYISVPDPQTNLRMVTVADFTFIVNRQRTVRVDPGITHGGNFNDKADALINVRGGQYGRKLSVTVNAVTVEHQLPPGDNAKDDPPQVDAQNIAEALAEKLRSAMPTWEFNTGPGYIHIKAPAGENISNLQTKDGYADQLINPVTHYVQSFNKLPLNAPDGYLVQIVGDTSKTADRYYVRYELARKVWAETVGWNVTYKLAPETMPWTLVRAADGNFDLTTHEWADREAGDDNTNPHPSIVDSTLNDIFFFRNRLGLISGENIVLSRTSKYFSLYPLSVANLSDDDPIDVAVSHNRVSILKYAVSFSEELLLWSDEAQFVLSASGVLSAKSIELNLTTQFSFSDKVRPFGIGRNIYYAQPRSSYTSFMRYYAVQDVSIVKNAEDMTAHVPNYIPNGVHAISGSGTENYACVLTSGAKRKIFIYKFLYLDEEIRQQAWGEWDMGENTQVLGAHCLNSRMVVIMQNDFNVWMAEVDFTKDTTDFPLEPYRMQLDMKAAYQIPTDAYDIETNVTRVDLRRIYGMNFSTGKFAITEKDGRVNVYEPESGRWADSPVINVVGNMAGVSVVVGFLMPMTYQFSKFLIKQQQQDGTTTTEDAGRLQLRRAWVNYQNSGTFDVFVDNGSRKFAYRFTGARIGSQHLRATELNLGTGQFRFPVAGNAANQAVTIWSEATTPLTIIGAGWEGNYMRRVSGI